MVERNRLSCIAADAEILADPRGDAERRERLARLRDFAVSQGMCGRAVGTVIRDYSHEFRSEQMMPDSRLCQPEGRVSPSSKFS